MKLSLFVLGSLLFNGAEAFQVQTALSSSRTTRTSFSSAASGPLSAYVQIAENTQREVGPMDEWATNVCGVQRAPGYQLTTEDGLDYSVMTTQDIPAGSPVVCVPAGVMMSTSRSKQEFGNQDPAVDFLVRNGAGDQVPLFYLFLKIMVEYQNGDQSPYYPWMNSLPRLYYNAISMTDFCYECVPPLVFSLARKEKVKFDNYFDALQKVDILSPELKSNRDIAKWAFNVATTRSFGPDNDKYIAPSADMFNHGTETEIDFQFDEQGNLYGLATKDIPAGSPLRMSYGCPTNPSQLFATYGFLDDTSPATFCKIMNINPTPQLVDIGFGFDKMLFYHETGEVSQEVWDVLLYQNLASNRDMQQAFYNAHMSGDQNTKQAIHQQYFYETSSTLKKHVDDFLKSLDDLSAKYVGKDTSQHPRLPLVARHNEFVKETFLKVKANLDPMVAQAAGQPVYQ